MITSGSPESRIASLERAVAQLQRQAAVREAQVIQRTRVRLAKVMSGDDSDSGSGETAPSCSNVIPIVFIDATFSKTEDFQELDVTPHDDVKQDLAFNLLGRRIGSTSYLVVLEQNRRHYIIAALAVRDECRDCAVSVEDLGLHLVAGYDETKAQALKHNPSSGSDSSGDGTCLSWIDISPCEDDSASDNGSGSGGGNEGLCAGWEYGNNGDPIGVYEWNGSIWDQVEGTGSFVCDDGGTVWIEGSEAQCPLSREGSFVGETANGYCIHETA